MTNKEKFLTLVTNDGADTVKYLGDTLAKRDMLEESFIIAVKISMKLDEIGWSQKELAEAMKVTPQQISKILRGHQNLTLETILKLQKVLDIPILASFSGSNKVTGEHPTPIESKPNQTKAERKFPGSNAGVAAQPRL